MGSIEAMQQGSGDRYFQDSEDDILKLVPEGIVAQVPFKGSLSEVVYQMIDFSFDFGYMRIWLYSTSELIYGRLSCGMVLK